jgi:two-component system, chemotaxis family, chemotaxis protein CheY
MKPTLIIVEDSQALREELVRGLEGDFEILAAEENGLQAVEACRAHRPQLVLMDIVMPKLSGIEATHRILTELPHPPKVIILSGLKDEGVVFQALSAGASDYLIKPCEVKKVAQVLRGFAREAA